MRKKITPRIITQSPKILYYAGYHMVMHDGIEFAGYLSFLALLSIFPFMVFFVALAGYLGEAELGMALMEFMESNLPSHVIHAIEPRITEIILGPTPSLLTISILGAIWTSSSAVEGLRTVLNRAYRVTSPPAYIWRRTLSVFQFILFTMVSMIAMITLIFTPIILDKMVDVLNLSVESTLLISRITVSFSGMLIFLGICSLYYMLPNIKQRFINVMPGAFLVMLLWLGFASLFSSYLANFRQVNLIYGSLEGIIATLLFFYVLNIIFIYGAEINYLIEKALGHSIIEKQHYEDSTSKPDF